ncbi:MAG TPA: ABC transporter permease, partial [Vicinamibacterales bacterium]|nr:ABC transporter permease [Vicinamibacterales bacterium]
MASESKGLRVLEGLFYDLRFALRGLRRDRAFTLAAVVMLALAIALNVTVFTVMEAMLFRGYPLVKRNDRLVYLQEHTQPGVGGLSYKDFEDWRTQAHAFEGMAYVGERRVAFRDADGHLIDTLTWTVSSNVFGLVGVPPMLGRDFMPSDEVQGAAPVAILNYRFWETRFNKRPDIVGLIVHVNDEPATIIGVMPERFDFPSQENLWMPLVHTMELERRGLTPGGYTAVGRLRSGFSFEEARAELQLINRRLETDYPATNRGLVPTPVDNLHWHAGPNAPVIYGSLWAGSWFVFLIACANLANLTLVRTVGRWRDFSTRIALGAGQGRMMRQIFMESLTIASLAGALASWITTTSVRTWAAATESRYQILDYRVDSGTIGYLVVVSILAALVFSLAPISRIVQLGVGGALTGDARRVT